MENIQVAEHKQTTQETYNYAAALLITQKKSPEVVINTLVQQGYSQESASTVVAALQKTIHDSAKKKAQNDMRYGGLVCVVGIIITVVTYSIASGGGTYVVAWGAIAFGAIQFLRGLFNSMRYK